MYSIVKGSLIGFTISSVIDSFEWVNHALRCRKENRVYPILRDRQSAGTSCAGECSHMADRHGTRSRRRDLIGLLREVFSSSRLFQSTTQIPSRFFDNYTRLSVRPSNLRIDRILARPLHFNASRCPTTPRLAVALDKHYRVWQLNYTLLDMV